MSIGKNWQIRQDRLFSNRPIYLSVHPLKIP